MYNSICKKCWASPCICGEQFKNSTTDHILMLMDALAHTLKQRNININTTVDEVDIKSYLLSKNKGLAYSKNSTLISLLEENGYHIPEVYRTYISKHTLVSECFSYLKSSNTLPYRTAFAAILYTHSLVYTDNSLQYFFFKILEDYTCLFENNKIKELLDYKNSHDVFCKNLYQVIQQAVVILKEHLTTIDKSWLLSWSILTRVQSFYNEDINIKFQAIKEITELISGNITLSEGDVFLQPSDMVDTLNKMTPNDYTLFEFDDETLLQFLMNKEEVQQPFFGMLETH